MEAYRINEGAALHYLTFSVIDWLPVFVCEDPCQIVTDSLNYCHREKCLRVNAFVIMPTHVHLILFDADFDVQRLQHTLADMRKYTGQQLSDYCEQKMPAPFSRALRDISRADRARQFWQQSRHPEAIYSQQFWRTKIDYLHDNPRRKGLVRDAMQWRFSSAAYWLTEPPGESDVILAAAEW
jgi:putative transposase